MPPDHVCIDQTSPTPSPSRCRRRRRRQRSSMSRCRFTQHRRKKDASTEFLTTREWADPSRDQVSDSRVSVLMRQSMGFESRPWVREHRHGRIIEGKMVMVTRNVDQRPGQACSIQHCTVAQGLGLYACAWKWNSSTTRRSATMYHRFGDYTYPVVRFGGCFSNCTAFPRGAARSTRAHA
ncbi:hypothetical protein BD414DRAFT_32147 [Trametes punicea]|nr:hypothetical protein BD414DRAFT_32147 [Trametes punicea]